MKQIHSNFVLTLGVKSGICPGEAAQGVWVRIEEREREREYSRQIVLTTVFLEIMRPYLYEEPTSHNRFRVGG